MSLSNIKVLLEIPGDETSKDTQLSLIERNVTQRLRLKLELVADEPIPDEFSYIVDEVSVVRFNRLGSEGMKAETVEGHSANYDRNDFDAYQDEIDKWLERKNEDSKKGRFTFV
jgi:Phage QLRG family, putative DNA packaging.